MEHTVTLQFAKIDVTFGHRLTGGDLMDLDTDPQAQIRTQYQDLLRRKAMTKYGDVKNMPPALSVLLKLNKIDRGIIAEGFDEFQEKSRDGRTHEFRGDQLTTKLWFGFKVNDIEYPVVEMKNIPTGLHEVEADTLGLDGLSRELFMIGKQISQISTEDGKLCLNLPIGMDMFREMDADDCYLLRKGAQLAEVFFRIMGGAISQEPDGPKGAVSDEGDRTAGTGDPEPAEPAN